MRSINNKLLQISLISVLVTAVIITSVFILFSKRALKIEAYAKLDREARNVEKLLTLGNDIDNIRRALTLRQLLFADPLITNRLILIDEEKGYLPIVAADEVNELNASIVEIVVDHLDDTRKYIPFNIEGRENIGLAYRVKITTGIVFYRREVKLGWLFLYVPIEELRLNFVVLRVFFISLVMSLLIGAAVSTWLSRRITRPLKRLSMYSKKISERKFGEIKRINSRDEFEKLSVDFIDMAEKLKNYDEKQKEFFQNASHNLKTPLMSIRGYAESILDGVAKDQEKALNVIIDETDKLTELVRRILFISKSESVDEFYHFEKLPLKEIVDEISDKVRGITNESGIEFLMDVDEDIYVCGDREKLIDAMMNIFSNCVRYARTYIKVSASDAGERVIINIGDDGDGIEEGEEERIFERFYKGKKGNYGLGLYITRIIIEKHKGSIRAYNCARGACLEITLEKEI